MSAQLTIQFWIGLGVGTAAVIEDLGWRKVSNWTSGGALLAGLAVHACSSGWKGVAGASLGAVAGFGAFLAFYLFDGMGGGDVKLMAGFGALIGIGGVLPAVLLAAAAGGLLAAAVVAVARLRKRFGSGSRPAPVSIPYAPAIVAGAWMTLISGS